MYETTQKEGMNGRLESFFFGIKISLLRITKKKKEKKIMAIVRLNESFFKVFLLSYINMHMQIYCK